MLVVVTDMNFARFMLRPEDISKENYEILMGLIVKLGALHVLADERDRYHEFLYMVNPIQGG